jgi:hypothetical protein
MRIRALAIILALLGGALAAAETGATPLATAVLNVDVADAALKPEADNIALLLNTHLSTEDAVLLVERQQLEAILGEQALGASGAVNPQNAARIGQLTGAKVILVSRLFLQGQSRMLVTKIIGTETGRVFAEVATLPAGEKQSAALKVFAAKLAEVISRKAADLTAPPEPADDRIARLKKILGTQKPGTISVRIPEQHLSQRVVDPAAETEIALTLTQLGLEVVTADGPTPAAFQITGEAVSERAVRRGDFISARARVEIKVVEAATGRVVLQDRQTEVAVDLAESVAAKNALQKAGGQLAERIVAKLAQVK